MKIKILALLFLTIGVILLLFILKDRELINEVKNHNYTIKYIIEPSMKDYRRKELVVDSDGNAVSYVYMIDESLKEADEGHYSQDELDDFIIYSIRRGMTKMNSDMDSVEIMDGSNIFFEIRIGDSKYYFGGYMANHVNSDFDKINSKFIEMKRMDI